MGGDARVTLAAVEEASRRAASAQAEAILSAEHERTRQSLDQARSEAVALIAQRRVATERLAQIEEQATLADARAQARAIVLQAQRSVLVEATAAAHERVKRLTTDPRYERLLERLEAEARERLSSAGPLELMAAPGGGLVARAGRRQIDCSLDTLVDRCLQAMGTELERLWR